MTQYLVAIHHPDDYDPSVAEDDAMHSDIDALNDEMLAAGVRIFVGGLHPASRAKSLRRQPNGEVFVTDGPYLETKEHIGGFGCWKPLIWKRRSHGDARPPSPAARRSRCAPFTDDVDVAFCEGAWLRQLATRGYHSPPSGRNPACSIP